MSGWSDDDDDFSQSADDEPGRLLVCQRCFRPFKQLHIARAQSQWTE